MRTTITILGLVCALAGQAQVFNMEEEKNEFDLFLNEITADFDNFRRQSTLEFSEFLKEAWKEFRKDAPVPRPQPTPVPPVIETEPVEPAPRPNPVPITIENIIQPIKIDPQPQPVQPVIPSDRIPRIPTLPTVPTIPTIPTNPTIPTAPVIDNPVPSVPTISTSFFGTPVRVRYDKNAMPHLTAVDERTVANEIKKLATDGNDALIADCLQLRDALQLSDWAYVQLLYALAKEATATLNDANLLTAYLYMQSGYQMRLASDRNRLYMLFGSHNSIFDRPSFYIDGLRYYGLEELPNTLNISQAKFPGEKPLTMWITKPIKLAEAPCEEQVWFTPIPNGPYLDFKYEINRNLMDFYEAYPSACADGNFMTQWSILAQTPLNDDLKQQIYPVLKEDFSKYGKLQAANGILHWIQTQFPYGYDDQIWGGDRAFFAEETLFYPKCDCEDRAILFSRLARDILGLNCLLVYYPGHLAAAVEIPASENPTGDYFEIGGRRFFIADPTITGRGAPIGTTMRGMDNSKATIILL